MLNCNQTKKIKGDAGMRVCTQQRKRNITIVNDDGLSSDTPRKQGRPNCDSVINNKLNDVFNQSKTDWGDTSKLCRDLTRL